MLSLTFTRQYKNQLNIRICSFEFQYRLRRNRVKAQRTARAKIHIAFFDQLNKRRFKPP